MAVDPQMEDTDTGVIPTGDLGVAGMADDLADNQSQNQGQDNSDLSDAVSAAQDALAYGRQKNGMPPQLLAGNIPAIPAGPGGDQPNPNPFPTKTAPIPFGRRADASQDDSSDTDNVQGAAKGGSVKSFANGGDMDNPINNPSTPPGGSIASMAGGGVLPQNGQPAPDPQQIMMRYAQGADAIPPEQAQALEGKVDPQGMMEPNERKLKAIASAPDKDSAYGLMQYYRQRFNAHNGFAQAAAMGTKNKPADMNASAMAATQAYHNVPDGNALSFTPTKAGVHVQVRNLGAGGTASQDSSQDDNDQTPSMASGGAIPDPKEIPYRNKWRAKNGKAAPKTPGALPDTTAFDAGGVVPDDTSDPTSQTDPTQSDAVGSPDVPAPGGDTAASDQQTVDNVLSPDAVRSAGGKVKDFVLSIPQYLGFLKGKGQYDNMMDNGAESALNDAQSQQAGAPPASLATQFPGAAQSSGTPSGAPQPVAPFGANPMSQQPDVNNTQNSVLPEKPTPGQINNFNASNGGRRTPVDSGIDPDVQRLANTLYPATSQSAQKAQYIQDQMGEKEKQSNSLALETAKGDAMAKVWGLRGQDATARNAATNTSRETIQDKKDTAAQGRVDTSTQAKKDIAAANQEGITNRGRQAVIGRMVDTLITQQPSLAQTPDKLLQQIQNATGLPPDVVRNEVFQHVQANRGQQGAPQGGQPAAQQGQQSQQPARKQYQGKWYVRGPNGEAVLAPNQGQ